MAVEVKPRAMQAELQVRRRLLRDAPAPAPVDKGRVLAHLRAQLAELQASQEVAHGDA
jgi:hypothetical protein